MRLTQIRLAGFKSFVDPMQIPLVGQLVGVVGPNGCGKSNIIDAVRWVLGESTAGRLRGESLQDVIFSGSSGRKPVSRASVELLFDNREGRAPGQWAPFAEIAVRRVYERSGDSNYYINNLPVRRRDIADLFLGTGVGARAYGIIEQGMVNRIVEARPEELRVFLEEAAGVSRYRERRKETEGRLGDARINLDRVEDVMRGLDEQIGRLTTQAVAAQRYRDLAAEQREAQAALLGLRAYLASEQARAATAAIASAETAIEAQMAQVRALEAQVEALRQAQVAAADALGERQAAMYAAGAEVTRIEQSINHLQQTRAALGGRVEMQLRRQAEEAERARQLAASQTGLTDEVAAAQTAAASARTAQQQAEAAAQAAEAAESAAREALDEAAAERQAARSAVQVAEAEVRLVEQRQQAAARNLARLEQEAAALGAAAGGTAGGTAETAADVAETSAEARIDGLRAMLDEQAALAARLQADVAAREPELAALRDRLTQQTRDLASAQARAESLGEQQRHQGAALRPWLEGQGLAAKASLLDGLRVRAGWEAAFEAVLGHRLQARCVDSLAALAGRDDLPPMLALVEPGDVARGGSPHGGEPQGDAAHAAASEPVAGGLVPLASLIERTDPSLGAALHSLIAGVFAAGRLVEALALRERLADGQQLVCPEGVVVWRHGLLVGGRGGDLSVQADFAAAQVEVARLGEARAPLQAELEALQARQRDEQACFAALQAPLEQTRRALQQLEVAEARRLEVAAQRAERRAALDAEIARLRGERAADADALLAARAEVQSLAGEAGSYEALWQDRQAAHADAREAAQAGREARRSAERAAQEAGFRVQTLQTRATDLRNALAANARRAQQIADELAALQAEFAALDDQTLPQALAAAVGARQAAEAALLAARESAESAVSELRECEQRRMAAEHAVSPLREELGALRVRVEAAVQQRDQQLEELAAMGLRPDQVQVPEDTDEEPLRRRVTRLQRDIDALGDVNLAAIAELAEATERRGFLEAQAGDLRAAIGTLEDAIRRIDRDSRERLQHTFDEVNRGLSELFPAMFGGGDARLELTGEEILDAGLHLTAHPPGKRNSTLALLSGGEKALTALALVFALFRLNPAPFCLLDEVDAPLDDTNTERFCQLVRRMSAQTQFIFITHNKLTMEMAAQLVGVTMPEPGVSRVVAVDVAEAVRLAAA
ncbi:MAG: chromosome segregation protein SMC [Betaproteobacteria bacterium]|nr:chromosome segregation protein SMC [Betaproteobacteria bacterium]